MYALTDQEKSVLETVIRLGLDNSIGALDNKYETAIQGVCYSLDELESIVYKLELSDLCNEIYTNDETDKEFNRLLDEEDGDNILESIIIKRRG